MGKDKKAKMSERDHTLASIKGKIRELGDDLAQRAVENAAETEQTTSFSVKVSLDPTQEPGQIKVKASGRITLSTGDTTEHMNLSDQMRLEEDGE